MKNDIDFFKIQPSSSMIHDKQGRTIALVWIFRPDIHVVDRHWFEAKADDNNHRYLCVEVGSDTFPVNCISVLRHPDQPNEWKPVDDEEIIKCFQLCHQMLSRKNRELEQLGGEILDDMILG